KIGFAQQPRRLLDAHLAAFFPFDSGPGQYLECGQVRVNLRVGEAAIFEIACAEGHAALCVKSQMAEQEGQASGGEAAHLACGNGLRAADTVRIALFKADKIDLSLRQHALDLGKLLRIDIQRSGCWHSKTLTVRVISRMPWAEAAGLRLRSPSRG